MATTDHKTKDFLQKIDLLIERGMIKNHQEVVTTLNWNKSVMSSVRNGAMAVPQHIYNKFRDTYGDLIGNLAAPVTPSDSYKDKYIAMMEDKIGYLQKRVTDLEIVFEKLTGVEKTLSEIRTDMYVIAAFQKGYQDYWCEHFPPKGVTPQQARKEVGNKASSTLKKILAEGIHL
jgi:hypothetical protein